MGTIGTGLGAKTWSIKSVAHHMVAAIPGIACRHTAIEGNAAHRIGRRRPMGACLSVKPLLIACAI